MCCDLSIVLYASFASKITPNYCETLRCENPDLIDI